MKINIENQARSISDLFFANHYDKTKGIIRCYGNNQRINKIIIPIYQREYDWEEEELYRLLNNTNEYINELEDNSEFDNYFVGTVLLEVHRGDNDKELNHHFELIDGQQRLTTSYLINFLGYLISIYRYFNLPQEEYDNDQLVYERIKRLNEIKELESQLFVLKSNSQDDFNEILQEFYNKKFEKERGDIIKKRLNIKEVLKNCESKLFHENIKQRKDFIDALENTKLNDIDDDLTINLIGGNEFNERLFDSFEFFKNITAGKNNDDQLFQILEKIKLFSNVISFCVLISESPDDSFKLFEVLNSTGRKLTILDKLKNYLYNKIVIDETSLSNVEFNNKWLELTACQESMGRGNITTDLAKSELSLVKDKFYQYFSNKELVFGKNKKKYSRREIFINESGIEFLDRILLVAKSLQHIYAKDFYNKECKPHTIEWNLRLINKVSYDWGRQVFLGSLILLRHISIEENQIDEIDFWSTSQFDSKETHKQTTNLEKFYAYLSDVLVKIGVVGSVNGLSSDKLPKISQDILCLILDFVKNEKKENDLKKLITDISDKFKVYISEHTVDFKTNVKALKYSHSGNKKMMTILLYVLYNKGKDISYQFPNPSLEHIEPKITQKGSGLDYFSLKNPKRDDLVDSFGNLLLIKRNHNSKLSNIPVKSKLEKIKREEEFKNIGFYNHDIFKNLILENHINGNTNIYREFPETSKYYTQKGVPKPDFFELRLNFYVQNISDMFCDSTTYLLSGDEYVMPN